MEGGGNNCKNFYEEVKVGNNGTEVLSAQLSQFSYTVF